MQLRFILIALFLMLIAASRHSTRPLCILICREAVLSRFNSNRFRYHGLRIKTAIQRITPKLLHCIKVIQLIRCLSPTTTSIHRICLNITTALELTTIIIWHMVRMDICQVTNTWGNHTTTIWVCHCLDMLGRMDLILCTIHHRLLLLLIHTLVGILHCKQQYQRICS